VKLFAKDLFGKKKKQLQTADDEAVPNILKSKYKSNATILVAQTFNLIRLINCW